ncbi:MAG TPA: hypothetical protein V6D18_15835 [Thermosynechococcaceae cyanobacterium]
MLADRLPSLTVEDLTVQIVATLESPLSAAKFCRRWVPIVVGVRPGATGFRQASCEFMSRFVDTPPDRIQRGWGKNFEDAPEKALRILRSVDQHYRSKGLRPWERLDQTR